MSASPLSVQQPSGGKVTTSANSKGSLQSETRASESDRLALALQRSNSLELRKIKNAEQLVHCAPVQRNNSLVMKNKQDNNLIEQGTDEYCKTRASSGTRLTHRVTKDILLDNYLSRLRLSNASQGQDDGCPFERRCSADDEEIFAIAASSDDKSKPERLTTEEEEEEIASSVENVHVPFNIVYKTPQKVFVAKQLASTSSRTKDKSGARDDEDSAQGPSKGRKKLNEIFHYFSRLSQGSSAKGSEQKEGVSPLKSKRQSACPESLKKLQSLSMQSLKRLSPAARYQQNPYESF